MLLDFFAIVGAIQEYWHLLRLLQNMVKEICAKEVEKKNLIGYNIELWWYKARIISWCLHCYVGYPTSILFLFTILLSIMISMLGPLCGLTYKMFSIQKTLFSLQRLNYCYERYKYLNFWLENWMSDLMLVMWFVANFI